MQLEQEPIKLRTVNSQMGDHQTLKLMCGDREVVRPRHNDHIPQEIGKEGGKHQAYLRLADRPQRQRRTGI